MDTGPNATDQTVINLDKSRIVLYMLIALLFVLAGIWMLALSDKFIREHGGFRYDNPYWVHFIGLTGIVFFSTVAILYIKKYFDTKPGLIFNSEGIMDNSSYLSAGSIPWSDIVGVEIVMVYRAKLIAVYVKNPHFYVKKQNWIKRLLLKMNLYFYGSPVFITPNILDIDCAEDLLEIFHKYKINLV